MKDSILFLEYLESENSLGKYGYTFKEDNLTGIKQKFYEKAELMARNNSNIRPGKKTKRGRLRLLIAAAIVFSLLTAAIASGIINLSPLINIIGERFGSLLQPINITDEYDGIEMKTLAALSDEDMIYIYFTMTDLQEDRIDSFIDIYDFIVTDTIGLNTEVISFDEATKTATLRISGSGGRELNGKKISMKISSLLTGAKRNEYDTKINMSEIFENKFIASVEHVKAKDITGGSAKEIGAITNSYSIALLKRDELEIKIPGVDWMSITNIGFVDGKLHIQINPDNNMGRFNHGHFYFADSEGNSVYYNTDSIYFDEYKQGGTIYGGDYIEYIFDISDIKQLEGLKLMGSFTTYDRFIEGQWESTFIVEQIGENKVLDTNIKLDEITIKKVTVSPLGVTLMAYGNVDRNKNDELPLYEFDMTIEYKDGKTTEPFTMMYYSEPREFNIKYITSELIDVDKVSSIIINEESIRFAK